MNTIYSQFVELRKKQEKLASDYEEQSFYEMAYLSRWHVLEEILQIMDAECRKKQLYRQVCEWKRYLENHTDKKPGNITSFVITKQDKTPDIGKIGKMEQHFDCELQRTKEIMDSKKTWRQKRNKLAHGAAPFRRKDTYEEFRKKIMDGITEIEQVLKGLPQDQRTHS